MYNVLIIILLSSFVSFAQSNEDDLKEASNVKKDRIIIGNRIYLNPENILYYVDSKILQNPFANDNSAYFISLIDRSLERFEDDFAANYTPPLASSYNSREKFILIDFAKNLSEDKKNVIFPMYITAKNSVGDKLTTSVFLFEIGMATPKIRKAYKTYPTKIHEDTVSYMFNHFLFKIRNFFEIPEPIKNVIHAND